MGSFFIMNSISLKNGGGGMIGYPPSCQHAIYPCSTALPIQQTTFDRWNFALGVGGGSHLGLGFAVRPRRQESRDHFQVTLFGGDDEGGGTVLSSDGRKGSWK